MYLTKRILWLNANFTSTINLHRRTPYHVGPVFIRYMCTIKDHFVHGISTSLFSVISMWQNFSFTPLHLWCEYKLNNYRLFSSVYISKQELLDSFVLQPCILQTRTSTWTQQVSHFHLKESQHKLSRRTFSYLYPNLSIIPLLVVKRLGPF